MAASLAVATLWSGAAGAATFLNSWSLVSPISGQGVSGTLAGLQTMPGNEAPWLTATVTNAPVTGLLGTYMIQTVSGNHAASPYNAVGGRGVYAEFAIQDDQVTGVVFQMNAMIGSPSNGSGGTIPTYYPYVLDPTASAAPEPAAWAMFVLGFGAIGAALRRRASHSLSRLTR